NLEASEARIALNYEVQVNSLGLIQDLHAEKERARLDIERRMSEREQFFASLQEDAERYEEYMELLEAEAQTINRELGIVQAQYRREVAEAERRRREEEERRRAEAAAAAAAERNAQLATLNSFDSFAWPVPTHSQVASGYGNRPDPFTGRTAFHSGIDITAPAGTRINAAEAGIVRFAGWGAGWGNYIVIDHADGFSTLYAHNSRNRVSAGARVTRGQHIADVGTTGRSTGNHLHFEIHTNGNHTNPMAFYGG
ncbi:MAG: M23 family metallopeptidase, partial [Clostridiales bacterium]|nr:M23 family metallopeptidase [Clostridiales bacterium]